MADILGRGAALPDGCRLVSGRVQGDRIRAEYVCDAAVAVLELRHPSHATGALARTDRFAMLAVEGAPPAGLRDAVIKRILARERDFRWAEPHRPSFAERALRAGAVALPAVVLLADVAGLGLAGYRGRRGQPRHGLPLALRAGAVAVRGAGLAAVLLLARRAAAELGQPPEATAAIAFGMVCVAGFLWLVLSGYFGYAGAERRDWVALLPFAVALAVRELFALHSIQEIEIQFARGPVDKHSVSYPLLQLFLMPLQCDPHAATMRCNALLGALACLPLYLFVRQRLDSRAAGWLAALFLAVNPLVARFAPTDGPYSLLLCTWFAGLALLSAPSVSGRAVLGGVVLLGFAASLRVEGVVLLAAAPFLLDPRRLGAALRRHRAAAALAGVALAGIVLVQLSFVLRVNLGNLPPRPSLDELIAVVARGGPLLSGLVAIGALSGIVLRRWLGAGGLIAMCIVVLPVAHSLHPIALHRLVPMAALQSMVAGVGAYALFAWAPWPPRWRWLAALPGTLLAGALLVHGRAELARPYVFTEEYALVRHHLAPHGLPARECALVTCGATPIGDVDIHDFGQVVPGVRLIDCQKSDCVAEVAQVACAYYVRAASCFYHGAGPPAGCDGVANVAGDACLGERGAAFERAADLEPVELRAVDLHATFEEARRFYPRRVEIGLFRVRPHAGR